MPVNDADCYYEYMLIGRTLYAYKVCFTGGYAIVNPEDGPMDVDNNDIRYYNKISPQSISQVKIGTSRNGPMRRRLE